jgi:hypothetical protein
VKSPGGDPLYGKIEVDTAEGEDYGKGVGVQEEWRNNPMHCEIT